MKLNPVNSALNKAYRKEKVLRTEMEAFKTHLIRLLDRLDTSVSEENAKHRLRDFLNDTWYCNRHLFATKGRTDLVIHTKRQAASPVGVLKQMSKFFQYPKIDLYV